MQVSSRTLESVGPAVGSTSARGAAWPTALIQRVAERVERAVAAHPLLSDLGLALAIATAAIVGLWSQNRLDGRELAFTLALCLPLLLRRRQPMLVFAGLALIAGVQWLVADPQLGDAALLVALYGIALRGNLIELALAGVVMEAGAVMAAAKWAPSDPVKVWIGLSGLLVAAGVFGVSIRQRRALLASLHERAARLEFERDQEGRLAAAAERNRIAREMHDIVAHNLSVMIALADGASYAIESSPARSAKATEQISATGRDALLEMRRLLGILRDEPSPQLLAPQPGLGELEQLVERIRTAGVPVELAIEGDPRRLSEGIQLTIFRVAQEALTNTLKHATRPTEASLRVRCGPDRVELEATDTGAPSRGAPGEGRGLRGMRERALAYGGNLHTGPRAEGGWRVHASASQPGSPMSSIRILLADDQELMRMGFRMVIESQPDLLIVGEAVDGHQAIEAVAECSPDIVLMDVRMPELDGNDATRRIIEPGSATRIIVLTTFDADEYAYAALRAGASGFLLKDAQPAELLAAIRAVASGDAVIAPSVTRRLLSLFVQHLPDPSSAEPVSPPSLELLTPREREVLIEVARSHSNAEIAERLVLSEATVKTHVGRILAKLSLRDRVQIVVFAYENRLIRPSIEG